MQGAITNPLNPRRTAPSSIYVKRARAFARNRLAVASTVFLFLIILVSIFAPWLTPYQPVTIDPLNALNSPDSEHLLGTDGVGRDVLTRLLYGGRISLIVGFAAVAVSLVVGVLFGAFSGYFGNWTDTILMRFTDAMLAIPTFFLLLLVLTIFGGSTLVMILIIGLTSWMTIARLVRGEILRFVEVEFVTAAQSVGASSWRVLFVHILPQTVSAVIVAATLGVAYAILIESALSYLGLGVQPPTPSWGNMLQDSQRHMFNAPMLSVYPGLLIFLTVLAFNFIGDGLRDAFDPRLSS